MAGDDWIKMRTDLYRDPKVITMADSLADPGSDLSRHVRQICERDMAVTRHVMRHVTVGALVSVWGTARHRGERDGDDLKLDGVSVCVLDDIADIPGFGRAMEGIGWVVESSQGLVFPRFFSQHNIDPNEDRRVRERERAKEYRARKRHARERGASRDVRPREEKRREESKGSPLPPLPAELDTPEFGDAWSEWQRHRSERRSKLTATAAKRQIKMLAEMGVERAIACIRHSITNGWLGLFEADKKPGRGGGDKFAGHREFQERYGEST